MNCFIMIKDKTGVNDTFTFSLQRGEPDSITMKAAAEPPSRACVRAGKKGTYTLMRSVCSQRVMRKRALTRHVCSLTAAFSFALFLLWGALHRQ